VIIKIENSVNFIHLFDDERTPSIPLKSVEGRLRYDFGTIEVLIPKESTRVYVSSDVVYLRDGNELFQLSHTEIGEASQGALVDRVSDLLNDRTGFQIVTPNGDSTNRRMEFLLQCINDKLSDMDDKLDSIAYD